MRNGKILCSYCSLWTFGMCNVFFFGILSWVFLSLVSSVSDPCSFDTDPDLGWIPIRFRIQGFDDQKFKYLQLEKIKLFLRIKNYFYLSQGLYKGRSSYRRSLQPSKENIQHFKTWNFLNFFLLLWVIFCPPGSGNGSTDLIEPDPNTARIPVLRMAYRSIFPCWDRLEFRCSVAQKK